MIGCTIVACNYLPYARVLATGWTRAHPEDPFRVLLLDGDRSAAPELDVLTCEDLGIADDELTRLRGIYGPGELNSAIKPYLLRALLAEAHSPVLFLDSDTEVHAPLDDIARQAERAGVALSPNLLTPPPLDGLGPSEQELGRVGVYNSGFIAVGPGGERFLDWWASRVRRDCLFEESEGLHADQRWLDWAPVYFEATVIRDAGVNVAHWNIHERALRQDGSRFTVDGGPLRTFHYAGFDPEAPANVTTYEWPSLRGLIDPDPALERLCRGYAAQLLDEGYRQARARPYGYARTAAGTPLGPRERATYRELVLAAEALGLSLPSPFETADSERFEPMLADPAAAGLLSEAALERLAQRRHPAWHPRGMLTTWRRRHWQVRSEIGDRTQLEYRPQVAHG